MSRGRRCLVLVALALALGAPAREGPAAAEGKPLPEGETSARSDRHGDPLPPGALARLGSLRLRHLGPVRAVAFAGGGQVLASADHETVSVWELATGRSLGRFRGEQEDPHAREVRSLALSADGKLLGAVFGSRLRVWELATGKALLLSEDDRVAASAVAFSPDAKALAAGHQQGIDLWDLATGTRLRRLDGTPGLACLAFSPDGKALAVAGGAKAVILRDVATGQQLREFTGSDRGFGFVTFSADGKALAASDTYATGVWDVDTGKELCLLKGYRGTVGSVGLSADGKTLAVGGSSAPLQLVDVASGKEVRRFAEPAAMRYAVALSPDGKVLASGSWGECQVRLWDVATGEERVPFVGHTREVRAVAFSPDGRTVASGAYDAIRLWDAGSGKQTLHFGADYVVSLAFSPDGKTLVSGEAGRAVRLWETATGKEVRRFEGASNNNTVAISPDGTVLASGGVNDRVVCLWEMGTGGLLRKLEPGEFSPYLNECYDKVFSPDGKTVAARTSSTIHLWDAATGKQLWQAKGRPDHVAVERLAFAPDGKTLASGSGSDGIINFWDAATGRSVQQLRLSGSKRNGHRIWALVFSPDGKSLAVGTWEDLRLLETVTGNERRRFPTGARALSFSPDGTRLASGNPDTTVLVWDLTGRLGGGGRRDELSPAEVLALWEDLRRENAGKAYEAVCALAAAPGQAVPLLKERLRPAAAGPSPERIAQWIADLDHDDFAVREKATAELAGQGEAALPALRKALADPPSVEVRRRLEGLLEKFKDEGGWALPPETLQALRAVEVLERIGTPEAGRVLEGLAKGPPEAPLTLEAKASLQRLVKRAAAMP